MPASCSSGSRTGKSVAAGSSMVLSSEKRKYYDIVEICGRNLIFISFDDNITQNIKDHRDKK